MPIDDRSNSNPWLWATLIFGLLGVVTTAPLINETGLHKPESIKSDSVQVDTSDALYPAPGNAISKKLGPWADPFEPINGKLNFAPSVAKSPTLLEIIQSQLTPKEEHRSGKLLVVAKIVSGKETEDGEETRRRHRHALELAMTTAGYSMPFPDRMTFTQADYDFYHTEQNRSTNTIDVPIKLYKRIHRYETIPESQVQLVLVAWIREEHLGERPLTAISQIVQNVIPGNSDLNEWAGLAIAGPSTSDFLSRMVREHRLAEPAIEGKNCKSLFYSGWKYGVTLFNSSCTASNAGIGLEGCQKQIQIDEKVSIPIAHVIGEDKLLIQRLVRELELRGRNARTVLFVEEQSQKYIEELKAAFIATDFSDLIVVPYLRGISKEDNKKSSVSDYLNRTFSQLRNQEAEAVSAVGVFGTQTSDKLAIFRAARAVFPTAAFFTTELDASYSEPRNYADCRNLLVASHFGLSCKTELFDGSSRVMPTFRDGYQTSAFLAMLIALQRFQETDATHSMSSTAEFIKSDQDLYNLWSRPADTPIRCSKLTSLQPLMFEISRVGSFQFPVERVENLYVTNQQEREALFARVWFLPRLFLGMLLLFAIGLVTRSYSSELTHLLNSTASMLLSVGNFFRGVGRDVWAVIRRTTVPANELYVTAPATVSSPPDQPIAVRTLADAGTSGWFVAWFVMVVVTTLALFVISWASDIAVDGEPVTWSDSISIWPSVLLFHVVSTISTYLIVRYIESNPDLSTKALMLAGLLLGLIICTMGTLERDAPPARGEITRDVATLSLRSAAGWLFFLASLSSLSILKARKDISSELKSLHSSKEDGSSLTGRAEGLLLASSRFHDMLVLAMIRGEQSSLTLIAPAALTIVLAVARLPLLDSWGLPRVWYAALMTPMLLSVVAAMLMRSEARKLKTEAIEKIELGQCELLGAYSKSEIKQLPAEDRDRFNDCMGKISLNSSLIGRLDRGPFGSVYNDPLLGGMLLIITAGLTGPMREQTIAILAYIGIGT